MASRRYPSFVWKATLRPGWRATVLAVAILSAGCREETINTAESPRPVVVVHLRETNPATPLRLTGTVEPWAEEDVAFEVPGRLTFIVEPGTFLEGRWEVDGEPMIDGDILAQLDEEPYEVAVLAAESQVSSARVNSEKILPAMLEVASARFERAEKEFARNERLRRQSPGALSEKALVDAEADRDATAAAVQQAEAERDAGEANLRSAKARYDRSVLDLGHTTLYAPFRGEVTDVLVQAGGYAEAGKPVAHLVAMDPIKVRVSVSAETHRRIKHGDPVRLFVANQEEEIVGSVYQMSTVADPSTRTFSITLICRNYKVWRSESEAERAKDLPKVKDLLPATRLDISGDGPLYVEQRTLVDERFVWIAEGINLRDPQRELGTVLTVRKVPVVPGPDRVNYQGIFLARELADPGELTFGQACVVGVPEGVQDGQQVALLPRAWLLQPGSLAEVEFTRDEGVPGYYVPLRAINGRGNSHHVFIVQQAAEDDDSHGVAARVDVSLHEPVGELRRIEPLRNGALGPGTRVIVEGASYIEDQEPVSVVPSTR